MDHFGFGMRYSYYTNEGVAQSVGDRAEKDRS